MSEVTQAAKTASPRSAPAERSTPAGESERLPEVDGAAESLVSRQAALLGDTRFGAQRVRMLQRLQRGYGNGHVAQVINRLVADAPPARAPIAPQQDPKFKAVTKKIGGVASKEKDHAPARKKVAEAQAAALPPSNDVASQAGAAQVDKMAQQKPGEFDKAGFIAAVKKAIDAAAPKNLSEADEFKESGKAGQVKGEVAGMVTTGKQGSEKAIKDTTQEAPDASAAKPKPVAPMGAEKAGPAPPDVGAKQAIPDPKSAAETSMAQGPADINQQMSQAKVTEDQLKKSNEPQFSEAVDAKKGAEAHSQQAPNDYRAAEKETLAKSGADASATATGQLGSMHATRATALGALTGDKGSAKSQDETKRAELATKIEGIFNTTKTEVTAILEGLDAKVNTAFETGEAGARSQFEAYVERRMQAYKDKRYGDWDGAVLWAKDKLMDMPSEVDVFYTEGRDLYLKQMDGVISRVADIVGGELGRAKARIALGKQQVTEFVASQPKELQKLAKEAEQSFAGRFDELEGEVNSKQESLVQSLADKYVASRDALDTRISELKAANKGLVSQALDAVGGVIKTILQLKDMLLGVLAKAAGAIETIIADPIKFLGNLVGAIKMGLNQFVSNIGTHLKKALMGWLFGTLGEAGIQLPDSFDLKGILMLVLQVIGLTYDNVRGIAVKLVGEKVVSAVEGTVKFFVTLVKEGPAGLWQWVKDKIAEINIKDMVIGAIKDFVITKIITAGVTWLISMLNPAAAFIKACKMIYDVIMFFIERGSQIMEFVNSVLDGIGAIAAGSLGAAAALVENSLAKILPLAISFLASLLGVGGIAQKIKEIIEKIRAPITNLVTAIMGPILKPLKKLYDKGAKFVKGVVDKGKALGKKALDKVKGKFYGGTDEDKQKRLTQGMASAKAAVNKYSGKRVGVAVLKPILAVIRLKNRLPVLEVVPSGPKWAVHGEISRSTDDTDALRDDGTQSAAGAQPGTVVTGFHGTNGDAILGILASGTLKPKDAKVFLAKHDFTQSFRHGGDTKRKAAFVLELQCTLPASGDVGQQHGVTPDQVSGVQFSTTQELPVKVLKMHVRKPKSADEGGGFEFSVVAPDKIGEYLSGSGESAPENQYRPPSDRHYPNKASIPKSAGNSMLLVDKQTVLADVAEINSGKARKEGAIFVTSSGRRYGLTGDELHPIDGPGIQQLSSQQYNLLKMFKDDPDKAFKTMKILTDKGILSASDAAAVHKIARDFLGVS